MTTKDQKAVEAKVEAAADEAGAKEALSGASVAQRSRVGMRRRDEQVKEARVAMRDLSPEQRQAAREKARVTSSGRGQPAVKGEAARIAAGVRVGRRFARPRRQTYKVLYFVQGVTPTEEEYKDSLNYPGAVFRNAGKIVLGAPLENCDAVAGAVPADYAAVFPEASPGMEIDDDDDIADVVARPRRQFGHSTAPDDVRPGTVDTGLAHASGTGSSQPGMKHGDPTRPVTPGDVPSDAQEMAQAWKTGKTPGATASEPARPS